MISVDEYRRLRRSDRQVLRSGELSDADLAALEETRAPESSKGFDDELESVKRAAPQTGNGGLRPAALRSL